MNEVRMWEIIHQIKKRVFLQQKKCITQVPYIFSFFHNGKFQPSSDEAARLVNFWRCV